MFPLQFERETDCKIDYQAYRLGAIDTSVIVG